MITLFDQLPSGDISLTIWGIIKFGYILFLLVYLAFAAIVVRQIYLMTSTVKGNFSLPLKTIGYAHLSLAILVLLLAFIIL